MGTSTSKSKDESFRCPLPCVAAAIGDVTVNEATVMCNCGSPNAENYVTMNNAHAECSAYPHDSAGHGSCIANFLGFLAADGRSADVAGPTGMMGDAAGNCDSGAIEAANFEAKGWVWPGVFDFATLDSALEGFFECASAAAVMACEDAMRANLGACAAP